MEQPFPIFQQNMMAYATNMAGQMAQNSINYVQNTIRQKDQQIAELERRIADLEKRSSGTETDNVSEVDYLERYQQNGERIFRVESKDELRSLKLSGEDLKAFAKICEPRINASSYTKAEEWLNVVWCIIIGDDTLQLRGK